MRRRKYYKTDRRGPIICMLITAFIFMLSVGYAALNEDLTISGEAHFRVEADIRITDVSLYTTTYSALEDYNSSFGKDSMKVGVTLPSNTSTVTYKVTVTNYGNVAMQLKSITKEIENNNYNITFNKTLPLTIGKTSSEEIEITFKNSTNESQTINANLLFTFAKLESMMTEGNKNGSTGTFYNGPLTKNSIESITFMSTKEIPEEAIGYWDCSYNAGSNEVMAYYLNSETEGMYDLYIAADGEVYAPTISDYLFQSFNNLKKINFNDSFNTEKVTSMAAMFKSCTSLETLDLSTFKTPKLIRLHEGTNQTGMFTGCSKLTTINFGHDFDTSKVIGMNQMFSGCTSLITLDLSVFNTENVTNMSGMFYNCGKLIQLDLSNFNTSKVTNMSDIFCYCASLISLDLSNFSTENVISMAGMFNNCKGLEQITFGINFKTSNVGNMKSMFATCNKLKSLDVSSFDTSKVTNMQGMFSGCKALTELNLSTFNTSKVTNMNNMFASCSQLKSIDLSDFNTEKVTSMTNMFQLCTSLTKINVTGWNTKKVTNMSGMFSYCYSLEEIESLGYFEIDSITTLGAMFMRSPKLTTIDISGMDFENKSVTTTNMFESTPSGSTIYVKNEYNKEYIENIKSGLNVIIPET